MADKGIIFSAPMVRALIEGRKTQTRRLLTLRGYRDFSQFGPSDTPGYDWHFRRADGCWCDFRAPELPLPYAVGDRLYVREAMSVRGVYSDVVEVGYRAHERASHTEFVEQWPVESARGADGRLPGVTWPRYRPSIHMPRWASRLWLSVAEVGVQRLRDINGTDAEAEGVFQHVAPHSVAKVFRGERGSEAVRYFSELWDSLHSRDGERWQDSPWIVAITFDVHAGNIDAVPD